MPEANVRRRRAPSYRLFLSLLLLIPVGLVAQPPQGAGQRGAPAAPGAPPPAGGAAAAPAGQGRGAGPQAATGRSAAPVDLTGYWVSIVTEDWIERMSPDSPPSGVGRGNRGQAGPPPGGANIEPCRVYGAAGSLRVPGRLNITWVDDNTLKIEMDAGTQTRLLHFNTPGPPPGTEKTLQGYSVATWDVGGGGRGGRGGAPAAPRWGKLTVVTTNLKGGYLLSSRSNYSENAVLTEHFSRHAAFGDEYFTVTAVVTDGNTTRATSSTFKKEPNGSKFKPGPCEIVR